ncbi:MAG: membrane protein insertase YidC [Sciscionella sp.]
MLNFIYYPVSFILWCWHKVFGYVLGDSNAIAWGLSIVFLVFTLRAILLKPAINQVRSMRRMQEFAPQMKAIQKKYAKDRQRQSAEMQKLQKEHGVNPVGGCLPMLLQIPVFIGLNHVLRSFAYYPNRPNYFFSLHDVHSYLGAKLFGAHLGDAIFNTSIVGGHALHHATWVWGVAPVAIPLMIIASIATHMTARLSVKRQITMSASGTPQSAMMQKVTLYIFPLGVLAFGGALPVGLLMYWVSNNIWTFGQQHFVFQRMDREEEEKKAKAVEQRNALAPKPGQKPSQAKNAKRPVGNTSAPTDGDRQVDGKVSGQTAEARPRKPAPGVKPQKPAAGARPQQSKGGKSGSGAKPAPGSKPAPGVKPQQSKGGKSSASAQSNGRADTGTEIPGLISDRTRKKKQDRKSR